MYLHIVFHIACTNCHSIIHSFIRIIWNLIMPSFISISSFTIDKILFYVHVFANNGNVFIVLLPNVVQDLINDLCWHIPYFWRNHGSENHLYEWMNEWMNEWMKRVGDISLYFGPFTFSAFSPEMHGWSKSHWRRLDLDLCTWYQGA